MIDRQLIKALALRNQRLMDGTTEPVRRILDGAQLVFAVWPDSDEPDGIGTLIAKGTHRLKAIAASGKPAPDGSAAFSPSQKVTVNAVRLTDTRRMPIWSAKRIGIRGATLWMMGGSQGRNDLVPLRVARQVE
jgi:hypothetical protein